MELPYQLLGNSEEVSVYAAKVSLPDTDLLRLSIPVALLALRLKGHSGGGTLLCQISAHPNKCLHKESSCNAVFA